VLPHSSGSCALALAVNISNFLTLCKPSPLAYQVLGHLKTSVILILGLVVFHYQYNAKVVVGAALALGGVVAYRELGRHKTIAVRDAEEGRREHFSDWCFS